MTDKTTTPPIFTQLSGPCGATARYRMDIVTFGDLSAKHLRNVAAQLELQASFLEESTHGE